MFLIILHACAVSQQLAGHDGACTASDNALCEGSSHVRLNPLFNTVCRRPVPVKLASVDVATMHRYIPKVQ